MKKKVVKIILIVVCIAVLLGAVFAFYIYNFTQKSEKISGKQEAIPLKTTTVDVITKGSADWRS
jgi:flagellar basal body-associated protein FliL